MKKYFLIIVMLFTMSIYSFAKNNDATKIERIENVEKYVMRINDRRLANYLQLDKDQMEAVEIITNEFVSDMMFIATECDESSRKAVAKNAIDKNIKHMSYVLDKVQYRKYLTILNATIINKKIEYEI